MSDYTVAAEDVVEIPGRAVQPGPTVERHGRIEPSRLRRGGAHAVAAGAEETLCGRPVVGLFLLDRPFTSLNGRVRCELCSQFAGMGHRH